MANAEMIENPSVIVVGGGVAGLTATHRLLQRGYDVTLIEANDFLGGKLAAHRRRDVAASKEKCSVCESKEGVCVVATGMNTVTICISTGIITSGS